MTRALLCLLVLVASGRAHADAPGATSAAVSREPTQVLSVPLWSLQQGQGIAVEYERRLARPHWSAAGVLGVRDAADGDYGSVALSLGGELRYWRRARRLRGWYAGVGVDVTRSSVRDLVTDREIGSTLAVAGSVSGGYRLVPWRRLEITPSVGIGISSELDPTGRLPAWHRGTVTTGVTVGWMY